MKTKYLLSTLAIGAAFVACTNEDLVVDEQMNVASNEVVGAKLLSKGLTLNFNELEDADSRATATGWEVGKDVAGLGWLVVGDPGDLQTRADLSQVESVLYNNHFFQYTEEGWNTKSNIYEGWHFAYFPYAHQSKPSELSFDINGKAYTGLDNRVDVRNNAPYLSGAVFLSEDNVDTANGTIDETLDIKRIVNAIYPTLDIAEDFTENDTLNGIAIKSLTLKMADRSKFYKTIKVVPSKLPEGEIESVDSLYADGALVATGRTNAITTTLEGDFLLNKDHQARFFLAPLYHVASAKGKLSVRVDVAGGHFDVAYKTPATENDKLSETETTNNEAIEKLNALFNTAGWAANEEDSYSLYNVYDTQRFGVKLALSLENFTADYLVENITDWNACVALADALKEEAPVFTLKNGAEVIFDGEMKAPKNGVTVECEENGKGKLIINGEVTWNENVTVEADGVSVEVAEDAVLTVEGVVSPSELINKGTILAGKVATVGIRNENAKFNNEGRVIVEYGAYVYTDNGVIAYEVPVDYSIKAINTLMSPQNAAGNANVNTLIVNEGVTLNCTETTTGEGTSADTDRYNPTPAVPGQSSTSKLDLSKDIDLEINGGSVVSDEEMTVGDVTIVEGSLEGLNVEGDVTAEDSEITTETIVGDVTLKGESAINDAAITGDVTVEEGTTTLVNAKIEGALTIKKGAKVVINSDKIMMITTLINDGGELESDNDIMVTDITLKNQSKTTLGEDWENTVWYTVNYVHNNSQVNGWVKKCPSTTEDLQTAINNAVAGSTIYLSDKVEDYGTITVGELKDVTIKGAEGAVMIFKTNANTKIENVTLLDVNFEYTGATYDCGVVVDANAQIDNLVLDGCTFTGNGTKAGRGLSGLNNNASIVIKNCIFKDLGYPIYAWGSYEALTIEGCTFDNIKSWAIMPQSGFDGDLTVTGCTFKNCLGGGLVKAGTLTAGHTFTFTDNTITGCTIAGDHNWFQFNVSAGTSVISGNTKDGVAWTPGSTDGLK